MRSAAGALVAVDLVVFTLREALLHTILVRIKEGPLAGCWAFPGGLVALEESLDAAARREIAVETGVRGVHLEQLFTFGDPHRDPGRRVVSVAYMALVAGAPVLRKTDRYAEIGWFPVARLPRLAYDHDAVARTALERLRAKLGYTNVAWSLLPSEFTLAELQQTYETILGRRLDRRNFRKKVLGLGLLRALGRERRGPHRPAALYAFRNRRLEIVEIL